MPQALLHPGVYIEEVPSGVRTITGVATSIALFIGWAARGPTDRAVRLTSYADYERAYGGLDTRSLLGYAVRQFFDNGGSDAYVVRLVTETATSGTNPTTAAATASAKLIVGTDTLSVSAGSSGLWGNSIKIAQTTTGSGFRLDVLDASGNVAETFVNLSMLASSARYAPKVINGSSAYLDKVATVTGITGATAGALPPPATNVPLALTGGADGTPLGPADSVFLNAVQGLFALGKIADRLDLFNLICVPGLTDASTIQALQQVAKVRRAFLIVDCAEDATVSGSKAVGAALPTGAFEAYSALYFPWVIAPNPLKSNALESFPPCGFIAGIYARTDASRGVWKAPAGTEARINGAVALTINMSDAENGQLNPLGINCLRDLPVYGKVVWGARTLDGNDNLGSEWKYVPVRRMALFLEESLYRGTQWVVFEPNDEPLWAQIRLNVGAFLNGLFRQGAFQGKTPKEAYFVKCDRETTTQADINLGIVNIMVGFAPLKPAEFVVIKIQQMAGDIPT
jgi:phage tail sheath protein FI